MTFEQIQYLLTHFDIPGRLVVAEPFGEGHINETYMICMLYQTAPPKRYIFQKINSTIFTDPDALINNVYMVTNFIKEEISKDGGDTTRETLTLIPTKDGNNHLRVGNDHYRIYNFIEDATCYQQATPELFYESAKAFGKFARQLDKFDATILTDTIVDFHNTEDRYQKFLCSTEENLSGRVSEVSEDLQFVHDRKGFCSVVLKEITAGTIPLRVCHNDTKLNNVMIDNETNKGLCVIDLDTVMKGSLLYDFGDSIRFGASSAAEDEEDLDLVYCDLEKYETYVKGYLEECSSILSDKEFELLAQGAILMTFECGMRFLTDHLNGDTYFRIHKPNHNLIRARNQFKLVADMEANLEKMIAINNKYK